MVYLLRVQFDFAAVTGVVQSTDSALIAASEFDAVQVGSLLLNKV